MLILKMKHYFSSVTWLLEAKSIPQKKPQQESSHVNHNNFTLQHNGDWETCKKVNDVFEQFSNPKLQGPKA